jgi:GWxTD domain-containing protein
LKVIGETNEIVGFFSTKLKVYDYNLEITLFDKGNIKLKTLKMSLKQNRVGNFLVLNPIYLVKDSDAYQVEVMGNALNFASKNKCIVVGIVNYFNVVDFVQYKLVALSGKTSKLQWQNKVNLEGKANVISRTLPNFRFAHDGIKVSFDSKASSGETSSDILFFEIPIPESLAFPQKYSLTLFINGSKKDTVNFEFEIFWDRPPFSLRNLNYAIDLAYYILTDEEFNNLKDAKKEEQEQKFFDLWRKFDTDTTTLFNEAMAVYYSRVDYAFFNYQTINEPDGAKTERGKIYILYGKPTSTSREIDKDDVIREVWYYDRLHKKFVFVSKDGKFFLESITNL